MTSDPPEQPNRTGPDPSSPGHEPEPRPTAARSSQHLDLDALSAYLDHHLPPPELTAARAHLAACPACARELAELRATVALLRDLPHYAARRDFQLGPAHARRAAGGRIPPVPGIDRWFDRLIPAIPVLRLATAAVAVLLVAVIAGDLIVNRGAGDVTMLPASSRVEESDAPEAPMPAMPRQIPAAQDGGPPRAAFQPTVAMDDDAESFAEPAAEVGTDPVPPASMEEDGAAGDAPGVVAAPPAADPVPPPSGWRLVQVGLGLALLWLIVSLVGVARLRRDRFSATAGDPNREA